MLEHLPALQVVLPLIAAPLCLLLHRAVLAWACTLLVSIATLVVAALLLHSVDSGGAIRYAIGDWAAPWGIEYRVDRLNALLLVIVAGIASIVTLYARPSVEREIGARRSALFYTAYLLCLAGLLGICITGDAFNLFVFLEISSLSSYALISMGRDRRALTAAYQYLIMGTIGATFLLIGIGLLYMMTGTLNMYDLAGRIPALADNRSVRVAFAFLTVGISLKLAVFPLHLWLPNAYGYAPSVVSAFLAATATKVAAYALLRFVFSVFGVQFAFHSMPLGGIFMGLGLLAVFSASIVAVFQDNIKRMFAYSSIAQIGYIVLGISLASLAGLTGAIVHLFNHALMKGALFLALGAIVYRLGTCSLSQLHGLAQRMPWTCAALAVGGLSLIGVPATAGFISKWYLLKGAFELDMWWLAALILLGSLLAVIYVWRVVEALYFKAANEHTLQAREAPPIMLLTTWLLVAANLFFGLDTRLTVGVAESAAAVLLGGTP